MQDNDIKEATPELGNAFKPVHLQSFEALTPQRTHRNKIRNPITDISKHEKSSEGMPKVVVDVHAPLPSKTASKFYTSARMRSQKVLTTVRSKTKTLDGNAERGLTPLLKRSLQQRKIDDRDRRSLQLLLPTKSADLASEIVGIKNLGGSFPWMTSQRSAFLSEAQSKVKQLMNTGKHRVYVPPVQTNRNFQSQPMRMNHQRGNHVPDNIVPLKRVMRSLDRNLEGLTVS